MLRNSVRALRSVLWIFSTCKLVDPTRFETWACLSWVKRDATQLFHCTWVWLRTSIIRPSFFVIMSAIAIARKVPLLNVATDLRRSSNVVYSMLTGGMPLLLWLTCRTAWKNIFATYKKCCELSEAFWKVFFAILSTCFVVIQRDPTWSKRKWLLERLQPAKFDSN